MVNELSFFLKQMRRRWHLSQQQLADRSGVGLKLVRSIEQGKSSLRMDKVNQVLSVFECELSPIVKRDCCVLSSEFLLAEKFDNISSYDMYGRIVVFSNDMALKLTSYWKRVLFSWMSACLDVSYKSFFVSPDASWRLPVSPYYDLLLDMLDPPANGDDLPLLLNGKRRLIDKLDWIEAMRRSGLSLVDAESVVEWGITNSNYFRNKIISSSIDLSVKTEVSKRIVYNRLLLLNVL